MWLACSRSRAHHKVIQIYSDAPCTVLCHRIFKSLPTVSGHRVTMAVTSPQLENWQHNSSFNQNTVHSYFHKVMWIRFSRHSPNWRVVQNSHSPSQKRLAQNIERVSERGNNPSPGWRVGLYFYSPKLNSTRISVDELASGYPHSCISPFTTATFPYGNNAQLAMTHLKVKWQQIRWRIKRCWIKAQIFAQRASSGAAGVKV
jgi:hypothetical protein